MTYARDTDRVIIAKSRGQISSTGDNQQSIQIFIAVPYQEMYLGNQLFTWSRITR